MGKSRNRPNQKKKAAARTQQIQARRKQVKQLVDQLGQEFAKVQEPIHTFEPTAGNGTFLTQTKSDIKTDYDNMEI